MFKTQEKAGKNVSQIKRNSSPLYMKQDRQRNAEIRNRFSWPLISHYRVLRVQLLPKSPFYPLRSSISSNNCALTFCLTKLVRTLLAIHARLKRPYIKSTSREID